VNVTLSDMGMTHMVGGTAPIDSHMMLRAAPVTAAAGKFSLVALNMGWRTHELVILPLVSGAAAGQRMPGVDGEVVETGSLGEASGSCVGGSGAGITAGTVGCTTVTLPPGRYGFFCNLANHYLAGMHQELVVTRAGWVLRQAASNAAKGPIMGAKLIGICPACQRADPTRISEPIRRADGPRTNV
jgi:uncharacterized cupredoxin-like copper-binding protein